jgi:ribosomal protein S12 methylthiotransferase accessory factor
MKSSRSINFTDIESYVNDDILDDINLILAKLKGQNLNQVIVINLTNPNLGIPVVRTIIPGLEMYKITKSVVGKRGLRCFHL